MKFNKQTKYAVKNGDVLKSNNESYVICNFWFSSSKRCMYLTLQDIKTKQRIYGITAYECYGMEIVFNREA